MPISQRITPSVPNRYLVDHFVSVGTLPSINERRCTSSHRTVSRESFIWNITTYSLIVVYLMTWWLTELVTNNAAAALIFPIAIGLADAMGANSMAFIMAVAFGASASFISVWLSDN